MRNGWRLRARRWSGLAAAAVLASCASLAPERSVHSTVALAAGQEIRGRIAVPDGAEARVQFQRRAPERGVPPHPEALTWRGGTDVLIAFEDGDAAGPRVPLGFAQQRLRGDRPCRVVLRNSGSESATFTWVVTGSCDVEVGWEFLPSATPR